MTDQSFDARSLTAAYRGGAADPVGVAAEAFARASALMASNVWITLRDRDAILAEAEALAERGPDGLPLFGLPFAVKDNIDVAGLPTTAACPEYAYVPAESAAVVRLLQQAGAILLGKTNLDQFATGLVGVRSPYGACRNPFDPAYVSGGSSSGSAVAVAAGAVTFSLGTDTAGSGRVPAAFCNIVGWKGTRGLVSARGVVPACRSLDCVTVFALTAEDAALVASVAAAFDAEDPFARRAPHPLPATPPAAPATFRLGVPRASDLAFFGNAEAPALFAAAVRRFQDLGGQVAEIELGPFLAAARLLYEGPWVAERTAAVGDFLAEHPQAGHPVVRAIVEGGRRFDAVACHRAAHRLAELARAAEPVWDAVDAVLTPTAGTIYRIDAVEADPLRLNADLGYYTNFMNLLDLAAVALPAGFQSDGLPFGVTLFAPRFRDARLLSLAAAGQRAAGLPLGATGRPLPDPVPATELAPGTVPLAVFGAHMAGLALNHELVGRGAVLIGRTRTAPAYRLYALESLAPVRPGLVRVAEGGAAIEAELWAIPGDRIGGFLQGIGHPLGLGKVELEDGRWVCGFICEPAAVAAARDVTAAGGWRAWLENAAGAAA